MDLQVNLGKKREKGRRFPINVIINVYKRNPINRKKKNRLIPYSLIISGFALILGIPYIIGDKMELMKLMETAFKEIGLALIICGAVSLILEFDQFLNYVLDLLSKILINDDYLERLNPRDLEDTKFKIVQALYLQGCDANVEDLYNSCERKIVEFVGSIYYSQYIIDIKCQIDHNEGIIIKTIKRTIRFVNATKEPVHGIDLCPIRLNLYKVEGLSPESLCEIKEFTVNGMDMLSRIKTGYSVLENSDKHDYVVYADYISSLAAGQKCTVKTTYITRVPVWDQNYYHRLRHPCKYYQLHFNVDNSVGQDYVYRLQAVAFGHSVTPTTGVNYHDFGDRVDVFFEDWVLPGDGVVINLINNGNKNNLSDYL